MRCRTEPRADSARSWTLLEACACGPQTAWFGCGHCRPGGARRLGPWWVAAAPATGRRPPAARPAAPRTGRSPPRCASSYAGQPPIITSAISTLPTVVTEPEAAAGMPNNRAGARASFEPRHGMAPAGRHLVLKLGRTRPAGGSGASPSGPLERYGKPQRLAVISIRRISRAVHPSSCDRLSQNGSAWEMSEVSGGRAAWRNPASVPCILT